jgi:hypothetical protein
MTDTDDSFETRCDDGPGCGDGCSGAAAQPASALEAIKAATTNLPAFSRCEDMAA